MKDFKKLNNEKGQLSIFLGISLIIVTTMIAFIINVGLFVKAKINLQNAVDAAAYSGAAVQSRQLTNMAYLNWEMRNTYKEWMFKYYVLGQLGLGNVKNASTLPGTMMDFTLKPFDINNGNKDPFNIPSICIHFGSSNNICELYNVPGLPRFGTPGEPSIADQFSSLMNSFTESKAKDCAVRSNMNFGAAMMWAYGTSKLAFNQMPLVASQRIGAWPQALELGLRMRNLEMIANRAPVQNICLTDAIPGCTRVDDLNNEMGNIPLNERPIKAFMAAYRNLSGGEGKDAASGVGSGAIQDDMALTFSLTEIAPSPFLPQPNTLSSFLIPQDTGADAMRKYYVDLQAYPLNLATFFTSFVTNNDNSAIGDIVGQNVAVEANCGATKTALPVPGYLFGFIKNPEVLTYYAVRGSAKFVGLFYPFADPKGIELTAYAAAKPYGGRIGPRLFHPEGAEVKARDNANPYHSNSYLSALNTSTISSFTAGLPIPIEQDFWVANRTNPIGGIPASGGTAAFAIPNLLYDYENFSDISSFGAGVGPILTIIKSDIAPQVIPELGLYSTKQFTLFRNHLAGGTGNVVITSQQVDAAIESVRQPTKYEALNYLIPIYEEDASRNRDGLESAPNVIEVGKTQSGNVRYQLFAPLYGEGTLFTNASNITAVITEHINNNSNAIESFLGALEQVADDITSQNTTGENAYAKSAESIFLDPAIDIADCTELSMASKFNIFFKSSGVQCDIIPLAGLITQYISDQANTSPNARPYSTYYLSTYKKPAQDVLSNSQLSSAYMPGERAGAEDDGTMSHPFGLKPGLSGKRNSYSTKFIQLSSVVSSAGPGNFLGDDPIYSEDAGQDPGNVTFTSPADIRNSNLSVKNNIKSEDVSDLGVLTH